MGRMLGDVAGIGAEDVLADAGSVRGHHDEIGAELGRLSDDRLVQIDGQIVDANHLGAHGVAETFPGFIGEGGEFFSYSSGVWATVLGSFP